MRRLAVTVGMLVVFGAGVGLSACGKKANPPGGAGGLGAGPAASQSGGPDGTGGLGTGPTAGPSGPASAGPGPRLLASKAGYVWGSDPTSPSYVAVGEYRYNSSGGPVSVSRQGTGSYRVTFAGLGDPGGVAHATAYGANANFCAVVRWNPSGADETVEVKCWDRGTAEVDTMFVANFAVGSQAGAALSYLWADGGNRTGRYTPNDQYRYDTTGQAAWIERAGAGHYKVFVPVSKGLTGDPSTFQVTSYGAATFRCKLSRVSIATGVHEVVCHDAVGTPYDSKFALTFSSQGSVLGRTDKRYGEYTDASAGTTNPATGVYVVPARELGQARGQVVAYATRDSSTYCHVGRWYVSGADLSMEVRCFDSGGNPAAAQFMVGVTW